MTRRLTHPTWNMFRNKILIPRHGLTNYIKLPQKYEHTSIKITCITKRLTAKSKNNHLINNTKLIWYADVLFRATLWGNTALGGILPLRNTGNKPHTKTTENYNHK